jgi:YfiH family protein
MMFDIDSMIAPTPAASFAWETIGGKPALVCQALVPYAAHVFTTRHWALASGSHEAADDQRWGEVADAFGLDRRRLVRGRQVHGANIVMARADAAGLASADIFISSDPHLAVAVQAADCVPLLIIDRRTGGVAAAHAGWRGMAARVPVRTVEALAREVGSRPHDLLAAIGPSIGACCYEVGVDVRRAFGAAQFSDDELSRWFLETPAASVRNRSMPGLPARPRPEHWFFDGWACVRAQLASAGVPRSQIFGAELCTASHPDWFCSYRREGASAGRLAGAIMPQPHRPLPH